MLPTIIVTAPTSSESSGAGTSHKSIPHILPNVPRKNVFNNRLAMHSEDALYTIHLHDIPYEPPHISTIGFEQRREYDWVTFIVVLVLAVGVGMGAWKLGVVFASTWAS